MNRLEDLLEYARRRPAVTVAVAVAEDEDVLAAVKEARRQGIAEFRLFGNRPNIERIAQHIGFPLSQVMVEHVEDPKAACLAAVKAVRDGKADVVMKGMVPTADFLRAVLDKEHGLRTGRVLSHVAVFEAPLADRLMLLTDAAMNIAPTLEQKVHIIENAVQVARALGIDRPKVALITAIETVNPDMPSTTDAAILAKMAERGQIKGADVDGPLALDVAVSPEAAAHKKVGGPVAGFADVLIVPNIETGNAVYKTLTYLAGAKIAGILVGAKAPVVVTSRADSPETKLYAIALAVLTAERSRAPVSA